MLGLATATSLWIVTTAAVAYRFHVSKSQPDESRISVEEDQVYEPVVRDMLTPVNGPILVSQVVFGETLIKGLNPDVADVDCCKRRDRRELMLEKGKLPYDSVADKVFRLFAHNAYDDSLRAATIVNFLERYCTSGPLSQRFRTDLTRTFIDPESVYFDDLQPLQARGATIVQPLVPRSRWDYLVLLCGGLCGTGNRYVLKKSTGDGRL